MTSFYVCSYYQYDSKEGIRSEELLSMNAYTVAASTTPARKGDSICLYQEYLSLQN
jgi:hypothetical protein